MACVFSALVAHKTPIRTCGDIFFFNLLQHAWLNSLYSRVEIMNGVLNTSLDFL